DDRLSRCRRDGQLQSRTRVGPRALLYKTEDLARTVQVRSALLVYASRIVRAVDIRIDVALHRILIAGEQPLFGLLLGHQLVIDPDWTLVELQGIGRRQTKEVAGP